MQILLHCIWDFSIFRFQYLQGVMEPIPHWKILKDNILYHISLSRYLQLLMHWKFEWELTSILSPITQILLVYNHHYFCSFSSNIKERKKKNFFSRQGLIFVILMPWYFLESFNNYLPCLSYIFILSNSFPSVFKYFNFTLC